MLARNVLTLLCLLPIAAYATDSGPVNISGFGSLGAITSSTDEVGYKRDISDPNHTAKGDFNFSSLSIIGLQLNANFSDSLGAVVQLVGRDSPEQNHISVLRLAALNYDATKNWQIRVGRTSPRIFLLSDSRLVGYSNLSTMPVQEFYSPLIVNYIDGIDSTYSLNKGPGTFKANISFGQTQLQFDDPFFGTPTLKLDRVIVTNIEYDAFEWIVRFSWAKASEGKNWEGIDEIRNSARGLAALTGWEEGNRLADDFTFDEGEIEFYSLGAAYDSGNVVIKSELGKIASTMDVIASIYSGYISAGYRLGDFTPYLLLAKVHTTDDYTLMGPPPAPAAPIAALITGYLDADYNQSSVSLGLRWDFALNKSLKIQWDHKSVYDNGYGLWAPTQNLRYPEDDVDVDIFSATFDFLF